MVDKKLPKGITQRSNGLYMGRFQYEGERYTLYDEDIEKLQNRIDDMKYELRHGIYEKEPKKHARVMTLKEQQLFLQYAKDEPLYDLMEVALFTGMRNGELRGLEWSDIDFKNRVIHVTGTLVDIKSECYKDTPKTATSTRDIPMLDNVYKLLRSRKKRQAEMRLMFGENWKALPHFQNLVFTLDNGVYIHRQYICNRINKIEEKIRAKGNEFQHISPHTLRNPN